ncbi:iron ABC transporter permease [Bacillus nakamurai]|uniref:Iron ABC transporter permease n=1 Tax=Bacillus nakamurai TaxID=1793963 RepID=A0A150F249_9BACI|nr:iron ABC transporter permease [Bacillus nakamurai]KXZ13033.1 iron ABC transporter permease [Bacillus nakamurai]KXZ22814.1 iron ABC transporter permease [Bacillus nakamurai]MCC9021872.1 iron ABC transporter permease [Bacillus nakamurai]MED1227947.1 iron ABC transporter permease [Bacillus nakamurai]
MKVQKETKKAAAAGFILLLIAAGIILIGLNTGSFRLTPLTVGKTLFGYGTFQSTTVLFDYRLPRILVTMMAGIGLGVSGAILQGVSRNALADPGILGLHAGASFGLMIYITFFHSLDAKASVFIPLFTFAGGTLAALMIVLLTYDKLNGFLTIRMLLVGIAVSAGFSAVTLFMSLRLNEETYTFASRWLVGNVWGRDWIHVWSLLPWIGILAPIAWLQSRSLNILMLGDQAAAGLGAHVQRKRIVLIAIAVGLSCASVAMAGGIGFIGFAAPHLARRLVGTMHQHIIPIAGLIGLVILVAADTIGRSLFQPNAIPAGVVAAAIGAPYFLYLVMKIKS